MIAIGDSLLIASEWGWPWFLRLQIHGWGLSPVSGSGPVLHRLGIRTPRTKWIGDERDAQANWKRHAGRWNVSFCDGHVESLKIRQLFDVRKDEILKRWNNDNQPHRELIDWLP